MRSFATLAVLLALLLVGCSTAVPSVPTPIGKAAATRTPAPAPTATAALHIGSTTSLADWTISLAKMESRQTIEWSGLGNAAKPSGLFWVIWMDARNTQNQTRDLSTDLGFNLIDDHGAKYGELSTSNYVEITGFARLQNRDALDAGVTPRALTHPLLVFDVAADAKPAHLEIQTRALLSSDAVTFQLTK